MNTHQRKPPRASTLIACGLLALTACDDASMGTEDYLPPASLEHVDLLEGPSGIIVDNDLAAPSEALYDEAAFTEELAGLTSDSAAVLLSCDQDNDCRSSCRCSAGACVPSPPGPMPPAAYCALPPTRACSSASDCRDGCSCDYGQCRGPGVSPLPALLPSCHLPPEDDYEDDDKWKRWNAYSGPQTHNFHKAGDSDWVAVYIQDPGEVSFRTINHTGGARTKLKVFAFDGVKKGQLLDVDTGGPAGSRVDLSVGPQSAFLMKVVDQSDPGIYTDSHYLPGYTLHLSYL